ncbi:MAG TPA: alpha/beta fold hydrolase [Syntrophobacteria bacterium]|nr:alpha/beta fold hydrolase [Syntrophobacteria bacterium]
MKEEPFQIFSDGLVLSGILRTPDRESWPLVVLCHGLLSYKNSSKYIEIGRVFAEAGIATIRFDFRGCGESQGAAAESTVSGRWRDLQRITAHASGLLGFNGGLALLGSSLGGYLALLEASRNSIVRCVSVWSTPSHLRDLERRLVAAASASPLFLEDLRRQELLSHIGTVERVLVLHGEEDELVSPAHGEAIFAAVKEPKAIHIFPQTDHRFTQNEFRRRAVALSLEWFQRFL